MATQGQFQRIKEMTRWGPGALTLQSQNYSHRGPAVTLPKTRHFAKMFTSSKPQFTMKLYDKVIACLRRPWPWPAHAWREKWTRCMVGTRGGGAALQKPAV